MTQSNRQEIPLDIIERTDTWEVIGEPSHNVALEANGTRLRLQKFENPIEDGTESLVVQDELAVVAGALQGILKSGSLEQPIGDVNRVIGNRCLWVITDGIRRSRASATRLVGVVTGRDGSLKVAVAGKDCEGVLPEGVTPQLYTEDNRDLVNKARQSLRTSRRLGRHGIATA
jgi:hypothetical protein